MNETTKARTAGPTTSMPASIHEMADKGIAQTKDNFKNAQAATAEAGYVFQNAYSVAVKGATDYNLKVFEIARFNINAAFDYARELLGVKTPSEFVELSSARVRQQFETMTAQAKELAALAQKVSTETAEPLKTGLSGALNKVA